MSLELALAAHEYDIGVVGVVEERDQVVAESALGRFDAAYRRLTAYVHRVDDDADLGVESELVVGQETVGLVQQEIASNELLKAPVFALHELVRSLALYFVI